MHVTHDTDLLSVQMHVIKRDGRRQIASAEKVNSRIECLCYGLDKTYVDSTLITESIMKGIFNNISTAQLDEYMANYASTLSFKHPDFAILAGRIAVSGLQKHTNKIFSEAMQQLYNNKDKTTGMHRPIISEDVYEIIMKNKEKFDSAIHHRRDFEFNYFGFRTLERSYLLKVNEKIVETPQYLFMRVAVGIHKEDVGAAIETYKLMSERWFTHATPTLFNAGRPKPQLSSCYLLTVTDDSIEGIYDTLNKCALISKVGGGIGLNFHKLRAINSSVMDLPRCSSGLVPVMKLYDSTAVHVSQNFKRNGSFAIYLEPWHFDIFDFIQLRLNNGPEDRRCRNLFLALWIPDLFMKRVENDDYWSLMSPNECPGLDDCWGERFEKLYETYESEKRYRKQIKARDLWRTIISSQCETGLPYMLYKDACNRKSNQQNLGTIKCSNLCTEIVEYSAPDEVAVCNLASIALNRFVGKDGKFDFEQLRYVAGVATKNLNKVIDVNHYPLPEARRSNLRHRPIGLGVQGLADAFILMRFPFTSPEAKLLNKQIFETIYYGALEASCELAEKLGPYETYEGCPVSKGILQYDMWNVTPTGLWNWQELKAKIAKHGIRNSLLLAPMPTASTAQILGNNEAFEPYTSNMYTRRVTKGDFQIVNQHLVRDLIRLKMWTKETCNHLIHSNGSVLNLPGLPQEYKELYKTVWEIKQTELIEMSADRGAFIDQSQSLNLFVESPTYSKCTTMHFKTWKLGLKTGMYYLRSKPSVNPVKFTVKRKTFEETMSIKMLQKLSDCQIEIEEEDGNVDQACLTCSS